MAALLATGPASAAVAEEPAYPHRSVRRSEFGSGARSYRIFEPAEPTPKIAPVIVFEHGWLAMNPGVYGAWIEHLVRRGAIVIYPKYQEGWIDSPDRFLKHSVEAVRDALDVLQLSNRHVKPNLKRFALIGHSTGGVLAMRMAASYRELGLPEPRAVVAATPGEIRRAKRTEAPHFSPKTLLVVTVGEHDLAVGDAPARELFAEAKGIPEDRKLFVLLRSDLRGKPGLFADHLAPTASLARFDSGDGPLHDFQMNAAAVNALDRSGLWRIADLTLEAAFAGRTLAEATRRGETFRRLGYWSDGRPVVAPIVESDPARVPKVVPGYGIRLIPW